MCEGEDSIRLLKSKGSGTLRKRIARPIEGTAKRHAAKPALTLTACASLLFALTLSPCRADDIAPGDRRSGYDDMSRETKAMQDDDTANPGMLAVLDGEALWNRKVGAANRSCADCHGDAAQSMEGVAARFAQFRWRKTDECQNSQPVNGNYLEQPVAEHPKRLHA